MKPSKQFMATVAAGVLAGVLVAVITRRFSKPSEETKGVLA